MMRAKDLKKRVEQRLGEDLTEGQWRLLLEEYYYEETINDHLNVTLDDVDYYAGKARKILEHFNSVQVGGTSSPRMLDRDADVPDQSANPRSNLADRIRAVSILLARAAAKEDVVIRFRKSI